MLVAGESRGEEREREGGGRQVEVRERVCVHPSKGGAGAEAGLRKLTNAGWCTTLMTFVRRGMHDAICKEMLRPRWSQ